VVVAEEPSGAVVAAVAAVVGKESRTRATGRFRVSATAQGWPRARSGWAAHGQSAVRLASIAAEPGAGAVDLAVLVLAEVGWDALAPVVRR